ncbi:MAG: aminodeoxychorismate/anthranilate synthase component II [candidate division Zixibacteria bacterium]
MLLLLDNYDSFTYNLVQYLSELGAEIRVFRNDEITVSKIKRLKPESIVLSPGPGRPENAGIMNDLVEQMAGSVPILGVCLGHQSIAQVSGAKIGYAPVLMHGKTSEISHNNSTLFKQVPSPFTATRYHSLVVERDTIPKSFKITAWTGKTVMAVENKEKKLYGVQFHPESILTAQGMNILNNFLKSV